MKNKLPWLECLITLECDEDCIEAIWTSLFPHVEGILPVGWKLQETDLHGNATFDVTVLPTKADANRVARILRDIEAVEKLKGGE